MISTKNKKWRFILTVFSSTVRFALLGFTVLGLGLLISLTTQYELSFQRSGSIMVALAVISVYINYFVEGSINMHSKVLELVPNEAREISNILREPSKDSSNKKSIPIDKLEKLAKRIGSKDGIKSQPEQVKSAFQFAYYVKNNNDELDVLNELQPNIVKAEFAFGVIGTLVWGFGDIGLVTQSLC